MVHALPSLHIVEPEPLGVFATMRARGTLRLRVLQHLPLHRLDDALREGLYSGAGDGWIRVGGVKMFLDGALGSRTAWMREPYRVPEIAACRCWTRPNSGYHVQRAARGGIASTVHAIGDAAVALALDVLADPATRVPGMAHRIEHVQCCPAERFADAARAGITCSMQPAHLITDWRIADRHWGEARASRTYAFHSLQQAGALLAFGSDAPVEPADPGLGLFAAVQRTDLDNAPQGGWHSSERLTAEAALRGYTRGPALAAGLPTGVLETGAPADFVAWQHDPLAPETALLDLRCTATVVGGIIVHS